MQRYLRVQKLHSLIDSAEKICRLSLTPWSQAQSSSAVAVTPQSQAQLCGSDTAESSSAVAVTLRSQLCCIYFYKFFKSNLKRQFHKKFETVFHDSIVISRLAIFFVNSILCRFTQLTGNPNMFAKS